MFDWLGQIGPYSWAVILLMVIVVPALAWVMTNGLAGYIIGGLLSCFVLGTVVNIICFEGTKVPSTNLPIGVGTATAMAVFLGYNLIVNRKTVLASSGDGFDLRGRIPSYTPKSIAAVVFGVMLIGVGVVTLLGTIDLDSTNAERGASIATNQFNNQSAPYFRRLEHFLAR